MALVAPWLVSPAWWLSVSGSHLSVGVGKEPSLDIDGLQVLALITSREVTEAARRPDVRNITCGTTRLKR